MKSLMEKDTSASNVLKAFIGMILNGPVLCAKLPYQIVLVVVLMTVRHFVTNVDEAILHN